MAKGLAAIGFDPRASENTMDNHSRWEDVKAKRRPPSETVRASIERELAAVEWAGVADDPRAGRADEPDAPEA